MFGFIKKAFFAGLAILSDLTSATSLSCISVNNQVCKLRSEIINVNSDEPVFYPFSIKTSKCSGNYNNINDPYAKKCVPDVVKSLNVKFFNLMSGTNETRHIKCHEMCKCKCRLDSSVCNNKQRWNDGKFQCECKELIDKGDGEGEYAIKDLFLILEIVSVNVINHVVLVNILIIKIVNVEKNYLIN